MKYVLKNAMQTWLPQGILRRTDKMGFPVPLNDWLKSELKTFVGDVFTSTKTRQRDLLNADTILTHLGQESKFGRKIWGLLCLELWYQEFIDKAADYRRLAKF